LSELARAQAFAVANDAAGADRVEGWDHGTAFLTPTLELLWDANYLRVDRSCDLEAPALAVEAERVLGGAGARHRAIAVADAAVGRRLHTAFTALGWETDRLLYMFLRGMPRPRPGSPRVEEVALDDLAGLRRELHAAERAGGEEVARQVAVRDARIQGEARTRWFAVRVDGRPVASCALLERGGTAEVDDVGTLAAHRGRGCARALVVAAAGEGRAAGAEVFLGAYLDDWPQRFYRRLGFEPVGMLHRFRLHGPFTVRQPSGNI
jgi:ribosomal protein S18 acetylase RimI-like enzyme